MIPVQPSQSGNHDSRPGSGGRKPEPHEHLVKNTQKKAPEEAGERKGGAGPQEPAEGAKVAPVPEPAVEPPAPASGEGAEAPAPPPQEPVLAPEPEEVPGDPAVAPSGRFRQFSQAYPARTERVVRTRQRGLDDRTAAGAGPHRAGPQHRAGARKPTPRWWDGFQLVYDQLLRALGKFKLTPVDAEGKEFDPHLHEAITYMPSEVHPAESVIAQTRRGYELGSRLLRAAPGGCVERSAPRGTAGRDARRRAAA